jgi:hypothetical protein
MFYNIHIKLKSETEKIKTPRFTTSLVREEDTCGVITETKSIFYLSNNFAVLTKLKNSVLYPFSSLPIDDFAKVVIIS